MGTLSEAARTMSRRWSETDPSTLASHAQEFASALARQARGPRRGLRSFVSRVREAIPRNGERTRLGSGLPSAREYMGERRVRGVGGGLVDTILDHPVQAILLAGGLGYLVTRRRAGGRGGIFGLGRRDGVGTKLADVMTRHVETVGPEASLREAAAKMADLDVGTIPVCDGGRLVGMLTDRDLAVRAVARGADPTSTRVNEIMTSAVRYAFEDEPVERAVDTMKRRRIRRLPIVDHERRLAGIVSLGDLAVDADREQAGDALQQVSAPSRPKRGLFRRA
jgi:CBS domain-containing protein